MAKVAVYAICKNEANHAKRFMGSMSEADGVYILDTGSQDESPRILRDLGAVVNEAVISPWRFDTARNMALAMVPLDADICVCCDLDEVFTPGWRSVLEQAWTEDTTRAAYPFYYDGQGSFFYRDLIHSRKGYIWAWPIHEALLPLSDERRICCDAVRLYHRPDPAKSRAQYLPILEQAVRAAPEDARMLYYLGREYLYRGQYAKAAEVLTRHIEREPWDVQRSAALRDLARCHLACGHTDAAEAVLRQSIEACPSMREGYIELASLYLRDHRTQAAEKLLEQALAIRTPHPIYFNEGFAWDGAAERLLDQCRRSQPDVLEKP